MIAAARPSPDEMTVREFASGQRKGQVRDKSNISASLDLSPLSSFSLPFWFRAETR